MFLLTKVISLKEDVFKVSSAALDPKNAPNVSVVGKERDKYLLIARTYPQFPAGDVRAKTSIEYYDFKTRELRPLSTLPSVLHIVGCSVNEDLTLLAYTVRSAAIDSPEAEYQSCIVEMHPSGQSLLLEGKSTSQQKVQFLWDTPDKSSYYLLLTSHEECSLIQIWTKSSPLGAVTITKKPKKTLLHKKPSWLEFDSLSLYILSPRPKGTPDEHILKCFNFIISKTQPFFEIPITINLPPINKLDLFFPYPYSIPFAFADTTHLHVVRFAGNGLCLCQQHSIESFEVKVSIFVVHARQKVEFSISLAGIEGGWNTIKRTRVLFDTMGNMLIVYIPGYFLQMIDCGEEHYPCIGMTINDREFAAANEPVPGLSSPSYRGFSRSPVLDPLHYPLHRSNSASYSVVPFHTGARNARDDTWHNLLDLHSGIIYGYGFNRQAVLSAYEIDSPRLHIQAMHLACTHLQDSELVDQIVIHTCTRNPHALTVELLKEYLIGSPFQVMTAMNMDATLLQMLPVTNIDLLDVSQMKKQALSSVSITSMSGYTTIPGTRIGIITKEEEYRRRRSPFERGSMRSDRTSSQKASVSDMLKSMFGINDESRPLYLPESAYPKNEETDADDCCTMSAAQFVEALADHWATQHPRESRLKLTHWAGSYRLAQTAQVNRIYSHLQNCIQATDSASGMHFQLLERLFIALEELALPFPRGFHATFGLLGLACLPDSVFLQYVDRGIIVPTPAFVREVIRMPAVKLDWKCQLIMRLKDQSKIMDFLQEVGASSYLLQYNIAGLPQCAPSEEPELGAPITFVDMELYSNSSFIPLDVLLGWLKTPTGPSLSASTLMLPANAAALSYIANNASLSILTHFEEGPPAEP